MGAILLVARAEARRRVGALVGLALLLALVGTAVLGSVAGARRSASALERFQDATASRDGRAFSFVLGADVEEDMVAEVAALDGVEEVGGSVVYATDASLDIDTSILAPVDDVLFQRIDRPLVLGGRLPDPTAVDEVVLSELAVDDLDLHTGDRLQATTFSDEDCAALAPGDFLGFNGPAFDLEVVGEVRVIEELQGSAFESGAVAIATPAFAAEHDDEACEVGVFASARYAPGGGPTDQEMTAAARRVAPENYIEAGRIGSEFIDGVSSAIDVVVIGLAVFALVAGLAGLVVLTQAVARQASASDGVDDTLGAMGLAGSQRALAAALPLVLFAVPGAVLAVVGAVALSPLFPLGVARRAEPEPGILLDPLLFVGGAVVLVGLVGVTAFVAVRRQGRRVTAPGRDSQLTGLAARAGAAPPVLVGLQLLDGPGRGRRIVRTAVIGTALAFAGVTAVMVVATSLSSTVDEPHRYGWAWSAKPSLDDVDDLSATIGAIAREDGVAAIAFLDNATLEVEGEGIDGYALEVTKGSIAFPVLEGRGPASRTEIALGPGALVAVDVGDTVTLRAAENQDRDLEVVGRVVLPPLESADGASALVTPEVMGDLTVDQERDLVLTFAEAADVGALESRLEAPAVGLAFPAYARPNPPGRLIHLEDIRGLFVALAGFFALLGLAGLVHALAASTRLSRARFATLRSLGFQRRQVVRSVAVFVLVIIGLAAVIGMPVGVVAGRRTWLAAVGDLGIVDAPSIPAGPAALAVLVAAAAGLVLAAGPAWREARRPPIETLRAE